MTKSTIHNAVRILKERIKHEYIDVEERKWFEPISRNEMRTRYALIDPLLRACGWELDDPATVEIEFSEGPGRIDYVLWDDDGNQYLHIEAKKMNSRKMDNPPYNTRLYEYTKGIRLGIAALTDGNVWIVYDLSKPGKFATQNGSREKRVAEFSISKDSLTKCTDAAYKWLRRK